jgi:hypothetical protein
MCVQVCSFNEEAAGSLFAVIVVAVLSTMFAVPPLMFIDYLGSNILVASIKGAKTRGDKGPTEADEDKQGKSRSNSKAAKVIALPTQDEDPDDDDASLEDVSMTDMTTTVSGEASKPQPRPGGLATLSQRLSPSNLRALQASMRQTMTNALTARQQRKEEKRQKEEEQNYKVKEETRKAVRHTHTLRR